MVTRWLHLAFYPSNHWGYPIINASQQAVREGKVKDPSYELTQMPLYITTRLDMLHRLARRLTQECNLLYDAVKKYAPQKVFTLDKPGFVVDADEALKYDILIDVDSFLFELNSCCDLIRKHLIMVCEHTNKLEIIGLSKNIRNTDKDKLDRFIWGKAGRKIKEVLEQQGQDLW